MAMNLRECLPVTACAFFLSAGSLLPSNPDTPLAIVDGTPITDRDLGVRSKILQLEKQAYDLRRSAIESAIGQRILEKAAAARNLSTDEFLRQEVDSKIPEPSPEEVEGFYWGQRQRFTQPLEQVRNQVAQMLRSVKVQEARQRFLRKLREQSSVTILLEPPRLSVRLTSAPRKGPATASVTIVEFSDYQCPYCKRAQSTLAEVLEHYGSDVSLVFKDLPIASLHPQAETAAQAARCAGEQGKYWEYHAALFAAPRLEQGSYAELARSLGLDADRLQSCLSSQKYLEEVNADLEEAANLGIQSTPTFLVNGIPISGAQPFSVFREVIDAELARAKSAVSSNR